MNDRGEGKYGDNQVIGELSVEKSTLNIRDNQNIEKIFILSTEKKSHRCYYIALALSNDEDSDPSRCALLYRIWPRRQGLSILNLDLREWIRFL
jgi:hypothetical protein